jgi:hypothetical protein
VQPPTGGDDGAGETSSANPIVTGGGALEGLFTPSVLTSEQAETALPEPTSLSAGDADAGIGADARASAATRDHALTLEATNGALIIVEGCAHVTLGSFVTAGDVGGSWQFTPADWPEADCPTETVPQVSELVAALQAAQEWGRGTEESSPDAVELRGPDSKVSLWPSQATTPLPVPVPNPGDPAEVAGLWRVEAIETLDGDGAPPAGPYQWAITIGDGHVTVPKGCNTGKGGDYVAAPGGYWAFAVAAMVTEMGCTGEPAESETTTLALGRTSVWELTGEASLVLTGRDRRVTLVRAVR